MAVKPFDEHESHIGKVGGAQHMNHKNYRPNERRVTMMFPRRVLLTTQELHRLEFGQGPNEVPESLVNPTLHPYLEANGVVPYVVTTNTSINLVPEPVQFKATEVTIKFLQSKGYKIDNLDDAQKFVDEMPDKDKPGFLSELANFIPEELEEEETKGKVSNKTVRVGASASQKRG